MRYYSCVREALYEIERDLVEMGIDVWPKSMQNLKVEDDPAYQTKEIIGYSFRVHKAKSDEGMEAVAEFYKKNYGLVQGYCTTEIQERVGFRAENPGKAWEFRPDTWAKFLNDSGKFDYTYSERLTHLVRFARETLQNDPNSRQAIMQVFHPTDVVYTGGKKRIPCSMYYQFLDRPRDFHVIYTMRSCDLYTHFGYDVVLAIMLAEKMKESLSKSDKPTTITMFIGSLHAYRKDYEPRGVF